LKLARSRPLGKLRKELPNIIGIGERHAKPRRWEEKVKGGTI